MEEASRVHELVKLLKAKGAALSQSDAPISEIEAELRAVIATCGLVMGESLALLAGPSQVRLAALCALTTNALENKAYKEHEALTKLNNELP